MNHYSKDNEVLLYPGLFSGIHYDLKNWVWANKKMKNIHIWDEIVPSGLKELPIPLSGQCSVSIGNRVFVIGGETTEGDFEKGFNKFAVHELTNDLHIYNFAQNLWYSTRYSSLLNGKLLRTMKYPRQNHACISYNEGGAIKIFVVGGVSAENDMNHEIENTAEILDVNTLTWRVAKQIPSRVTGSKLILVNGRPTIVGMYGDENQDAVMTYTNDDAWEELPIKLLQGRSDFMVKLVENQLMS